MRAYPDSCYQSEESKNWPTKCVGTMNYDEVVEGMFRSRGGISLTVVCPDIIAEEFEKFLFAVAEKWHSFSKFHENALPVTLR